MKREAELLAKLQEKEVQILFGGKFDLGEPYDLSTIGGAQADG